MSSIIRVHGHPKYYDWGSHDALYRLTGTPTTGQPLAEIWFSTHPLGMATTDCGNPLRDAVGELGFLTKFIAPARALSLQVHPSREQARVGHSREEMLGIALDAPQRMFTDTNHKPEMLYALSDYQALVGIAPARVLREWSATLTCQLGQAIHEAIARQTHAEFVRDLLARPRHDKGSDIAAFVDECRAIAGSHRGSGAGMSSSSVVERCALVAELADSFGIEPGVVVASMMNIVHLRTGEAVAVPVGTLHAYRRGIGFEVMAASNNVMRAGLTSKFIDADAVCATARLVAEEAPLLHPVRLNDVDDRGGAASADGDISVIERWDSGETDFDLTVMKSPCGVRWVSTHPTLVSCLTGTVSLRVSADEHGHSALPGDTQPIELGQGQTCAVTAGTGIECHGDGTLALVTRRKAATVSSR